MLVTLGFLGLGFVFSCLSQSSSKGSFLQQSLVAPPLEPGCVCVCVVERERARARERERARERKGEREAGRERRRVDKAGMEREES